MRHVGHLNRTFNRGTINKVHKNVPASATNPIVTDAVVNRLLCVLVVVCSGGFLLSRQLLLRCNGDGGVVRERDAVGSLAAG